MIYEFDTSWRQNQNVRYSLSVIVKIEKFDLIQRLFFGKEGQILYHKVLV